MEQDIDYTLREGMTKKEWNAFDFPCSRTVREYEAWLNEEIDLPDGQRVIEGTVKRLTFQSSLEERIEEIEQDVTKIVSQPPHLLSAKQWDSLNQLKGEIKFLERKLNDHISEEGYE